MPTLIANRIAVRKLGERDRPLLEQMYETYEPLGAALGLPPRDAARRTAWLDHLAAGINVAAFLEDRVVGHLVLMPSGKAAEMALFVHQDFRRQRVATALVQAAREEARAEGVGHLWVLVSSDNFPARKGLERFGFRQAWEDLGEVQMVLPL